MEFKSVTQSYRYFNKHCKEATEIFFSCVDVQDSLAEEACVVDAMYYRIDIASKAPVKAESIDIRKFDDALNVLLMLHKRHPKLPIFYFGREVEVCCDISRDPVVALGRIGSKVDAWWDVIVAVSCGDKRPNDPIVVEIARRYPMISAALSCLKTYPR